MTMPAPAAAAPRAEADAPAPRRSMRSPPPSDAHSLPPMDSPSPRKMPAARCVAMMPSIFTCYIANRSEFLEFPRWGAGWRSTDFRRSHRHNDISEIWSDILH